MQLAELIASECQIPPSAVMLLRHGNDSVQALRRHGVTVEEFTAIQPIESKYDYLHSKKEPIEVVTVIVDDCVFRPFRVIGIDAEGTDFSVASDAYQRFKRERSPEPLPCRRFSLQPLPSVAIGLSVQGWVGRTRTPVQRSDDSFFAEIHVGVTRENASISEQVQASFERQVESAVRDSPDSRRARLARAPQLPTRVLISSYAFARNPDVVAETLLRAEGHCQLCGSPAPFIKRKNGEPYLEVHHRRPLAEGGLDTVENAIAVCPNCHRRAHHA